VSALSVFGAPEPPPPASPETTPAPTAEPVPVLEVKNKSSFVMDDNSRNPFWPIGWKPAAKQNVSNESSGPQVQAGSFAVTSITVDQGGRFAIINGKAMTEGQVFGLQVGNQTYQITVKAIEDGQVVLLRRDQEIFVPLRRR
jgi:hypothetical protein